GEQLEQRALARRGETDDADLHGTRPFPCVTILVAREPGIIAAGRGAAAVVESRSEHAFPGVAPPGPPGERGCAVPFAIALARLHADAPGPPGPPPPSFPGRT